MNLPNIPWRLLVGLGALLVTLALGAGSANATVFGEVTRFGERAAQGKAGSPTAEGKLAGQKKGAFTELEEAKYAIGVDSDEANDVFVLDEPIKFNETNVKEERDTITRHIRIQKFEPSSGKALASHTFALTSPEVEEEEDDEAEAFEIAVDPAREVIYVLAEEPRKYDLAKDVEAPVATTLYAFKTKESSKELVPAANANSETGVLVGPGELAAESEESGKPLIEPRGITVDPKTGEVIVLAHIDEAGEPKDSIASADDHFVLQRITPAGNLGKRYVDKQNYFEKNAHFESSYPSSPVVTGNERVLVRFEGITEIPYDFESEAEPKQLFAEPQSVNGILNFGEEGESGDALSLSPEGTLYEPASIINEGLSGNAFVGGIALRSSANGSLLGWSGGQSESVNAHDECVLEPGVEEEPLYVAAGSEEAVFVLAPEYLRASEPGFKPFTSDAIVELGPKGKAGCPAAKGSPVSLSENGIAIPEKEPVAVENEVQLSTRVLQADALAVTWNIEDKATKTSEKLGTLEFPIEELKLQLQEPTIAYKFKTPGEFVVTAKIDTDDLVTPEVETTAARTVTADAPVHVSKQPEARSISEGSSATFTAEAAGTAPVTVEWEVSTNEGKNWSAIESAKSDSLTIEKATPADSGNQYRAVFKNSIGGQTYKAISDAAMLTVAGKPKAPAVEGQPASRSVVEGESAAFTAKASGSPVPTVQWEVSMTGGSTWSEVKGASSPTLTVEKATLSESGSEYRAKFTNEFGSATSSGATLTVTAPPAGGGGTGGGGTGGGGASGGGTTGGGGGTQQVLSSKVEVAPVLPKATVAGTSTTVTSAGALSLEVSCPAGETRCIGTITLRTLTAVSASSAGARAAKAKRAILTLTSGSFSVAGGATQTVKLHLSAAARKLLTHAHTLRARATLAAHDVAGAKHTQEQILTLRLAKKR